MATKSFAIPLDARSKQSGDTNFEALKNKGMDVQFKLNHVSSGETNELNLITSKNGETMSHVYAAVMNSGSVMVTLSAQQVASIFDDAAGGNWDYVEAMWTVGEINVGGDSSNYEIQGGSTYDRNGWPPVT